MKTLKPPKGGSFEQQLQAYLLAEYAEAENTNGLTITDSLVVDVADEFLKAIKEGVLNLLKEWLEQKRQESKYPKDALVQLFINELLKELKQ